MKLTKRASKNIFYKEIFTMRKITKTLLIPILTLIMCFGATSINANAAEIQPRLSHVMGVDFSFAASESGGRTLITCYGYDTNILNAP